MPSDMNRIYIAGHLGMVGQALVRRLAEDPDNELLVATRAELDLTQQEPVREFIHRQRPDTVIIAAAKVGGIHANDTYPADFIYDNLMIASNLIHASYKAGVKRVLFLSSSCVYPKFAAQPMPEDCLLTSALEPSNEAYAIAKIAGMKLCQYYRKQYGVTYHSAMPTNLYGPGDNYHPRNSHVVPAMIRRFHEAKQASLSTVAIWGTGTPLREFLHVDDLASACGHLLKEDNPPDWINIGASEEISILEIAKLVAQVIGYTGEITTDTSKLDGTPRKLMDSRSIATLGWSPQISLQSGLQSAYAAFLSELDRGDVRSA